jgi:hypothetical protein
MGTATGCHMRVSGEDAAFHGLSAGRFTLIILDRVYRPASIPIERVDNRTRLDPSLKAPPTYCLSLWVRWSRADQSHRFMNSVRCYGEIMRTIFW